MLSAECVNTQVSLGDLAHLSPGAWGKEMRASLLFLRLWNRENTRSCCPVVWLPRLALSDFCFYFLELLKAEPSAQSEVHCDSAARFQSFRCVRNKAPQNDVCVYVRATEAFHYERWDWQCRKPFIASLFAEMTVWWQTRFCLCSCKTIPLPMYRWFINLNNTLKWDFCYLRFAIIAEWRDGEDNTSKSEMEECLLSDQ